MTPGERCDEIVRLIEATLEDCGPVAEVSSRHLSTPVADEAPTPVPPRRRPVAQVRAERLPRSA